MSKLLITDLDNTLYDWVTFFSKSFAEMLRALAELTGLDRDVLVAEFKKVHQAYGNSEQPFALLELPSIQQRYGTTSRNELMRKLDPALYAFNRARKEHLRLYPSVENTLATITRRGVVVVGHTEAIMVNSYWRLKRLGVDRFFRRLYALDGKVHPHPDPSRGKELEPPVGFVEIVPKKERKPNPALLADICRREGFSTSDAVYVGDSLTRDMSMAKMAGVKAVWARYGANYERSLWDLLVSITHWTAEDVDRESELKKNFGTVKPEFTIDSFSEIVDIIDFPRDCVSATS
jgi:FMN phosphatase YigB (HAD superfamily)